MALRRQDFEIWAGDDKELIFTIEDVNSLAGASFKWAMSRSVGAEKLVEKSGDLVTGKQVTVELAPEDTEELRRGKYYHELEITDASGRISTAAIGAVDLFPTLIRAE